MKRTLIVILIGLMVVQLNSCKKENSCDCFKSTGTIVSESRSLSGFSRITIENDINVYLKQDSIFDVQVVAGKNLISLIKTVVKDDELIIKNNNKCNFVRSYEPKINVYISMPVIKYIKHKGTGLIQSMNTITTSEFDIWSQSSGDVVMDINNDIIHTHLQRNSNITLTGKCKQLTCFCDHSGALNAENLIAEKHIWFVTKSSSDAYVRTTTGLMEIKLMSIGNIYYTGTPTDIILNDNGKGSLIKL